MGASTTSEPRTERRAAARASDARASGRRRAARRDAWSLLQGLWWVSTDHRIRGCRCARAGYSDALDFGLGIEVRKGEANFTGLQRCDSVHACPMCAPVIRRERAAEMDKAATAWLAAGHGLAFVTLTLSHKATDPLTDTLSDLRKGWSQVLRSAAWTRLRKSKEVAGAICALDYTHGDANGWHPHLHVLVFLWAPLSDDRRKAFRKVIVKPWESAAEKNGHQVGEHHGVRVVRVRAQDGKQAGASLGWYIAKVSTLDAIGSEAARLDSKRGKAKRRTPFQILADGLAALPAHVRNDWMRGAPTPDDEDGVPRVLTATGKRKRGTRPEPSCSVPLNRDLMLWREYERATYGRQAITWTAGLHALVDPLAEEPAEEVVDAGEPGDCFIELSDDEWKATRQTPARPPALLEAAEDGGEQAVRALLVRWGCLRRKEAPSSSSGAWTKPPPHSEWLSRYDASRPPDAGLQLLLF